MVIFDRGNRRVGFASSNQTDPETGRSCGEELITSFLTRVFKNLSFSSS